jgi:hypothetical protein
MPSSYPTPGTNSTNQARSPSSQSTTKQQPLRRYEVQTISSYHKKSAIEFSLSLILFLIYLIL